MIKCYFRRRSIISLEIQKYGFFSIPSDASVTSMVKYVFLPRKINLEIPEIFDGIRNSAVGIKTKL